MKLPQQLSYLDKEHKSVIDSFKEQCLGIM